MKKISMRAVCTMLALLILVSLASGCAVTTTPSESEVSKPAQSSDTGISENNPADESSAEESQTPDTSEDEKPVYTLKDEVISEGDAYKVTLKEVSRERDQLKLDFALENKTADTQLSFNIEEIRVNTYGLISTLSDDVNPGELGEYQIVIFDLDEKIGADTAESLSGMLEVYPTGSFKEKLCKESFTVYPTGLNADTIHVPERRKEAGEQVVLDNEYCTFVIYGPDDDGFSAYCLDIFLANKTDSHMYLTVTDVKVNDIACDPFFGDIMPANSKEYSSIRFSKSKFESAGITAVEKIDFTVYACDYDNNTGDYFNLSFTFQP